MDIEVADRLTRNHILGALPKSELARASAKLAPCKLVVRDMMYERDQPIDYVYFPVEGVISIVSRVSEHEVIEVATVGNEGMVGLPLFLNSESTSLDAFAQVPGEALRMSAGDFIREIERNGSMVQLLRRYTQALLTQIAQASACNRLHTVEERCARWLLMTHDRVSSDTFLLTQQFLAQMLGVRRASVTVTAGALQKAGAIRYRRGVVTIMDRAQLQEISCECYGIIVQEYSRLVGATPRAVRRQRAKGNRSRRKRSGARAGHGQLKP